MNANIAEELKKITEWATSPSQKLENRLHGTVAFFIMPILTLANTGVTIQKTCYLN